MKKYKLSLYISYILALFLLIFYYDIFFYAQIPDDIYVEKGTKEEIEFALPVTGEMEQKDNSVVPVWEQNGEKLASDEYLWKIKLLGVFDVKDVAVHAVETTYVYPLGNPIGIYVKTEGVLVAGLGEVETMSDSKVCPAKNIIQTGDYILEIDGVEVNKKEEVIENVKKCLGQPVVLKIKRNGEISQVKVFPAQNKSGIYQIGTWVRDSAQGIGTLSYLDESGNFGALGHGINDIDTLDLMSIAYGNLYDTQIVRIERGSAGEPGELAGVIYFSPQTEEGSIEKNTPCGIYGSLHPGEEMQSTIKADRKVEAAMKQDIELGKAAIWINIDGSFKEYEVEITNIDFSQSEGNWGIELKVTDAELLEKTGGILRGMSGAPIIQNGKFIGAVTHVFVNDPTRGYGIFGETMLRTAAG